MREDCAGEEIPRMLCGGNVVGTFERIDGCIVLRAPREEEQGWDGELIVLRLAAVLVSLLLLLLLSLDSHFSLLVES